MASPTPWIILPFLALLAAIALAPLLVPAWWQHHYPKVAFGLGAITLVYYLAGLQAHAQVGHTAMEYVSFLALIGSLFVVSGGIHISIRGQATPLANTVFLALGACVANLLGTTGASMLLIRPWLRMNRYRVTAHHVVFFIFLVSNIGGGLTPVGDPPLFLGYLRGIPFWWVAEHCWPMWAMAVALTLMVFYVLDLRNYRRAPPEVRRRLAEPSDVWRFEGRTNLGFLFIILGAVFLREPRFLREALMVGAALGSYFTTRPNIHEANHFNLHPLREVAILFAGIFATMMPALDWLQAHAAELGSPTPGAFYWATGSLSSFLDNAPTYLSFFSTASGAFADPELVRQVAEQVRLHGADISAIPGSPTGQVQAILAVLAKYNGAALASRSVTLEQIEMARLLADPVAGRCLVAISVSAVFFGANTYIGNGPNFMVKAIADQKRVHTPTFLGYVWRYTLPCLLPILLVVWLSFFRT